MARPGQMSTRPKSWAFTFTLNFLKSFVKYQEGNNNPSLLALYSLSSISAFFNA